MKLSLVTAISAAFLLVLGQRAPAEDLASSIVGVWKYTGGHIKEVASGKIDYPLGQNPTGQLVYTKGGHIVSVLAGDNRKAPASPAFTDAERITLFNTMAALSGTYKVERVPMHHGLRDKACPLCGGRGCIKAIPGR